jgi:hypothetical protein
MMKSRKLIFALAVLTVTVGGGWAFVLYRGTGGDLTQSAEAFLGSLSDEQRAKASMEYANALRLDWHFIPKPERKGLQVKEMNDDQRKLAHQLLESGLSQIGYDKATKIMSLEAILLELEKGQPGKPLRDTERYYFTLFGQPAPEGKWGLSIEGHHLSLNFVVENGKVISSTPAFFGANPAVVQGDIGVGPKKGTRVLAKEETLAFDLLHSLTAEQRQAALIADKAPTDVRGAGEAQPPDTAPEGLVAEQFNADQVKTLWSLLETYAANMPEDIGGERLEKVRAAGIEKVYFAWAGADQPGIGHYYRLQGPTFLVEFVNTQPDAEGNPANHIHSMWRDTAGDFGVAR